MRSQMRYPVAVAASILSIAVYFTLFWGFDALRVLTSPNYGLEDAWRSQIVYWIARWIGLSPVGLLHLAALFGAVKLAVAGVCAVHIFDRIRCFRTGKVDSDVLEIALLMVVAVSIVMVTPAIWQHDATLIRTCTLNLVLASLAAALGTIERSEQEAEEITTRVEAVAVEAEVARAKPLAAWFAPWR